MIVRERSIGDIARERYGHLVTNHYSENSHRIKKESNSQNSHKSSKAMTNDYSKSKRLVTNNDYSHYGNNKRDRSKYSPAEARAKAQYLASKLNNESRLLFYLKCAWNLEDQYLDRLLQISLKKTEPAKYFSKSASKEMM